MYKREKVVEKLLFLMFKINIEVFKKLVVEGHYFSFKSDF